MPRCLMATFATMKKFSEEGGREERGVSRNRGLPRNPRIGPSSQEIPKIESAFDWVYIGPKQPAVASQPDSLHGSYYNLKKPCQKQRTLACTDIPQNRHRRTLFFLLSQFLLLREGCIKGPFSRPVLLLKWGGPTKRAFFCLTIRKLFVSL